MVIFVWAEHAMPAFILAVECRTQIKRVASLLFGLLRRVAWYSKVHHLFGTWVRACSRWRRADEGARPMGRFAIGRCRPCAVRLLARVPHVQARHWRACATWHRPIALCRRAVADECAPWRHGLVANTSGAAVVVGSEQIEERLCVSQGRQKSEVRSEK